MNAGSYGNGFEGVSMFSVGTTRNSQVDNIVVSFSRVSGLPTLEKLIKSLPGGRADVLADEGFGGWLDQLDPWAWCQLSFLIEHHQVKHAHIIGTLSGRDYINNRRLMNRVGELIKLRYPSLEVHLYDESINDRSKVCTLYKLVTRDSLKKWDICQEVAVSDDESESVLEFLGCADNRTKEADFETLRRLEAARKIIKFYAGSINPVSERKHPCATNFFHTLAGVDNLILTVHEHCGYLSSKRFPSAGEEMAYQHGNQIKVAEHAQSMAALNGNPNLRVQLLSERFCENEIGEVFMEVLAIIPRESQVAA